MEEIPHMIEQDVVIQASGAELAGTFIRPETGIAASVAVFVHGSGAFDRDENQGKKRLDVFNTLAADLKARGIASLRYDKRGCAKSTGDYFATTLTSLSEDVIAALRFAEAELPGARTVLIGHSEGTLLSVLAHARHPVSGLVLITPFITDLEPVLIAQAETARQSLKTWPGLKGHIIRFISLFNGDPVKAQRKFIDTLKTTDKQFKNGLQGLSAPLAREWFKLDTKAAYGKVDIPTLLIGGEKDLQCDPEDVARITEIVGDKVEGHVMKDMTHILRRDPGPPAFHRYGELAKQPLDPELVARVGDWVAAQS